MFFVGAENLERLLYDPFDSLWLNLFQCLRLFIQDRRSAMSEKLERMVITAYRDENYAAMLAQDGNPLTVWINPENVRHHANISHNEREALGRSGAAPRANRFKQKTVYCEVLDQFRRLVVAMDGTIQSPNYLKLTWAQQEFHGVLTSMNISHHLFRSDGTPLRAKVALACSGFTPEMQPAKLPPGGRPDLSHLITVTAGDTLPDLCMQIYGDSRYYLKIAAFNGITGFRRLMPGMQLLFPPITGSL